MDDDSGNILFSCDSHGGWVTSNKKHYVRFRIQVFHPGEAQPVLDERLDMKDKPVVIFSRPERWAICWAGSTMPSVFASCTGASLNA